MTAPTDIPGDIPTTTILLAVMGCPVRQDQSWTTDRITRLAHSVGFDAMAKVLGGDQGREPYVFDLAFHRLEGLVYDVMGGDHVSLAVHGARAGFIEAAIGFWRDIGVTTGSQARNLDLAALTLEGEVLAWTAMPGITVALLDSVSTGIALGVQQRQPEPMCTGRDTPPKHARSHPRKEPVPT